MKAKKVIALVMCAAMVAGMSASSVMAADMPEQFKDLKANEAYDFPMMVKSFQSTYWDAAQEGMKKAADELGVTYKAQGPNSESDIADQVNMINTAIAAKPAGLGLAACDTSSVLDALQECVDKGIPVVTFDTGIADAPEGSVVCEVCTDNTQAGSVAAENMYKDTDSLYSFVRLYFDDEESDTNNIFVFEEYINKEAFELQMKSERYKAFKDTIADMLYMSLDSCIKRGYE